MATSTTVDAAELKQSARAHCLHWLAHGHCTDPLCTLNERQVWLTKLTGWTLDGNPELMWARPPALTLFHLQDMVRHCFALGLTVAVVPHDATDIIVEFRLHDARSTELQDHQ